MYIETHLTPRFCDTDALGHINNTAVTQWLEAGRMDFFMNHLKSSSPKVMRRMEVDYDREMSFPNEAVIRTGVESLSNRTITIRQEIFQKDNCCVKARLVECYFDPTTRAAIEIPQQDREMYGKLMFNELSTESPDRL